MAKIKITWIKSAIGYAKDQKATIKAMGLHKLNHTVVKEDNPTIRGMVLKVRHLVEVTEDATE
ncbi:50S ribosomal protein L30 [Chloroflexota bacterium]